MTAKKIVCSEGNIKFYAKVSLIASCVLTCTYAKIFSSEGVLINCRSCKWNEINLLMETNLTFQKLSTNQYLRILQNLKACER